MFKSRKQIKIKRCTTIRDVIETLNWCDTNKYKILYISFNPVIAFTNADEKLDAVFQDT